MERLKSTPLSRIAALVFALGLLLVGCSPGVGGKITDVIINAQDSFRLSDAFDEPISEAYVFCEYHDEDRGEGLGFKKGDFSALTAIPNLGKLIQE